MEIGINHKTEHCSKPAEKPTKPAKKAKEVLFYITPRVSSNHINPDIFALIEEYCQKRKIDKRHIILSRRLKDDDIREKIQKGEYSQIFKIVKRKGFGLCIVPDKNYNWLIAMANSNLKI